MWINKYKLSDRTLIYLGRFDNIFNFHISKVGYYQKDYWIWFDSACRSLIVNHIRCYLALKYKCQANYTVYYICG